MGTEDRVNNPEKKIPSNSVIIPYVTFPGQEIKDLIVHDTSPTPEVDKKSLPSPPKKQPTKSTHVNNDTAHTTTTTTVNASKVKPPTPGHTSIDDKKQKPNVSASTTAPKKEIKSTSTVVQSITSTSNNNSSTATGAGTGAHLLKLREKKGGSEGTATVSKPDAVGEFDFNAGLNLFKKNDVLAKVAIETEVIKESKYKKDDFFDSLSCDLTDRKEGRNTRLTNSEERTLNQDTFGAIALQNNYRRNYSRGGYNNSGRGNTSGRGRGRGSGGRGRGNSSNYNTQNVVKV